jgi:acetate kinase
MSILVLSPNRSQLAYSIFSDAARESVAAGRYAPAPDSLKPLDALWRQATGTDPRVVAIRVPFGGSVFRRPAVVTPQVAATLRELVPESPLHLPLVLSLIERCQRIWTNTLLVLVFETAFFADLPQRERLYGLDSQLTRRLRLRRYGYHGIYHGAACQLVARRRLEAGLSEPAKILSVCLEPRPEVAAAIGTRPQMVTGGATPLEGIPGQTSCGELDSSIVLTLARKLKWGPEQIDRLLTRQSGILGLLGRPATLDWSSTPGPRNSSRSATSSGTTFCWHAVQGSRLWAAWMPLRSPDDTSISQMRCGHLCAAASAGRRTRIA